MSESSSLHLEIGRVGFRCSFPSGFDPACLESHYVTFRGNSAEPPVAVTFFVDEKVVEGWKEAEPVFTTDVWELRRSAEASFVVGRAYGPPQPFWVARTDEDLTGFSVARVGLGGDMTDEHVVEPAVRILLRLALMHQMFSKPTGMVLHAAAAMVSDSIVLFPGCSGAGKSTFSRRLLGRESPSLVNDDRMIITRDDDAAVGWTAWGTPWPGELDIALDVRAPLGAIFFLEKSDRSFVERLSPTDALNRLMSVVSVPWYNRDLVLKALDLCDCLVAEIPSHVLYCLPDDSAVAALLGERIGRS